MPAAIINVNGCVLYGTHAQVAALLAAPAQGAAIRNLSGITIVIVDEPLTRADLPASAQPVTVVTPPQRRPRRK